MSVRPPNADRPHTQDGDEPLDARTPEGTIPAEPRADVPPQKDSDPADEIPVPLVMSPAEIDERAQAVEAVRDERDLEPRTDV
jgi:hypothetical protein